MILSEYTFRLRSSHLHLCEVHKSIKLKETHKQYSIANKLGISTVINNT